MQLFLDRYLMFDDGPHFGITYRAGHFINYQFDTSEVTVKFFPKILLCFHSLTIPSKNIGAHRSGEAFLVGDLGHLKIGQLTDT
jgi:hypothetical protein